MSTLAQLITTASRERPDARYGTVEQPDRLDRVVQRASAIAARLESMGLQRGDIVAILGPNSSSYLVTWMACQLAGIQTALINPTYPDEWLDAMLDNLAPRAILWAGRHPGELLNRKEGQFDLANAWDAELSVLRQLPDVDPIQSAGEEARHPGAEIAAYLHTSGTTGLPKFCALSHSYFLRLGRFFADALCLSRHDTVLAPLPMFHINPLGYGIIGSLVARASSLSMERFSANTFWSAAKENGISALVLHFPPANLLVTKTTEEEAQGHRIRIGFGCGPTFLRQFDVPIGVTGYGSTEAGGLCHSWRIRPDDDRFPIEGPTNLAGKPRNDLEHRIGNTGEILVRGLHPQTLFSGYLRGRQVVPQTDGEGWFHTGDRGRLDIYGNLIFIERTNDSIRVNGEYVPIEFVEERLRKVTSIGDFALWRQESETKGHEVVLYATNDAVRDELSGALSDLPKFMQPVRLIRIAQLPRDTGVGKVQRRLLADQPRLSVTEL